MNPMPSINHDLSLVVQEEMQREMGSAQMNVENQLACAVQASSKIHQEGSSSLCSLWCSWPHQGQMLQIT